jgi:hypothetical protein
VTPEKPVISYLTPLTGVTRDLLESEGMPLAAALVELRRSLPPSAVLVGQNILKDVQVLVLVNALDVKFMLNEGHSGCIHSDHTSLLPTLRRLEWIGFHEGVGMHMRLTAYASTHQTHPLIRLNHASDSTTHQTQPLIRLIHSSDSSTHATFNHPAAPVAWPSRGRGLCVDG